MSITTKETQAIGNETVIVNSTYTNLNPIGPENDYPCYCNIGGYCTVSGSQSLCGWVAASAPTYWCGVGSRNCPTWDEIEE
jgi:hypothetical protein